MSDKYPILEYGGVVEPMRRGWRMVCCDCGLVHRLNFYIVKRPRGRVIRFTVRRDSRATAQVRRWKKVAR